MQSAAVQSANLPHPCRGVRFCARSACSEHRKVQAIGCPGCKNASLRCVIDQGIRAGQSICNIVHLGSCQSWQPLRNLVGVLNDFANDVPPYKLLSL